MSALHTPTYHHEQDDARTDLQPPPLVVRKRIPGNIRKARLEAEARLAAAAERQAAQRRTQSPSRKHPRERRSEAAVVEPSVRKRRTMAQMHASYRRVLGLTIDSGPSSYAYLPQHPGAVGATRGGNTHLDQIRQPTTSSATGRFQSTNNDGLPTRSPSAERKQHVKVRGWVGNALDTIHERRTAEPTSPRPNRIQQHPPRLSSLRLPLSLSGESRLNGFARSPSAIFRRSKSVSDLQARQELPEEAGEGVLGPQPALREPQVPAPRTIASHGGSLMKRLSLASLRHGDKDKDGGQDSVGPRSGTSTARTSAVFSPRTAEIVTTCTGDRTPEVGRKRVTVVSHATGRSAGPRKSRKSRLLSRWRCEVQECHEGGRKWDAWV